MLKDPRPGATAWGVRSRTVDGMAAAMATFRDRRVTAWKSGVNEDRSVSAPNKWYSFLVEMNHAAQLVTVTSG